MSAWVVSSYLTHGALVSMNLLIHRFFVVPHHHDTWVRGNGCVVERWGLETDELSVVHRIERVHLVIRGHQYVGLAVRPVAWELPLLNLRPLHRLIRTHLPTPSECLLVGQQSLPPGKAEVDLFHEQLVPDDLDVSGELEVLPLEVLDLLLQGGQLLVLEGELRGQRDYRLLKERQVR